MPPPPRPKSEWESAPLCMPFFDIHSFRPSRRSLNPGGDAEPVSIVDWELADAAEAALPFQLTAGQRRALGRIRQQVATWPPMICLLQASDREQ